MCMLCHKVFRSVFGENQISSLFIWSMRIVVVLLNAMPVYVMNYEMNEWIENKMDLHLIKLLFNSFVFMTLWAYFAASFLRPRVIPNRDPTELLGSKNCIHCKNWKP